MKTILHLIDTTGPGGAETVFIQLADKMRSRGFKSVVVIRGPGWVQDELINRGLDPYVIETASSFAIGYLYRLVKIVKAHQINLIQSHLLGSNVYAAMTGLLCRVPVVATYHGMVDVDPNERFKSLKKFLMQIGINRYIAVSRHLRENIRRQKLLDINKTTVIHNGVDLTRFDMKSNYNIKRSLGLSDNVVLVGCLGNVRPAKAYHVLIKAAEQIKHKYPKVHFVIAGHKKPSLMKTLDGLIDRLDLQNHFHFLGFVSDSAEFLLQMDLFVLTSSSEGFSIATVEAMAAGLPVLVTRCGGPEEIVTAGENGLMVEPNDPVEIAKGLVQYIESSELGRKMAAKGKAHVDAAFSLEFMLDQYESEYKKLI